MNEQICEWCGFLGIPIEVHGHFQCGRCHTNINPCCSGETSENCEIDQDEDE